MACAVIFGGTGFVGAAFARFLLDRKAFDVVYLFDREAPDQKQSAYRRKVLASTPNLVFVQGDVRQEIHWRPEGPVDLIANFAAVHREPGHEPREYYETNLQGAENVCRFAEQIGCARIVFTSSISPYGVSEEQRDEQSLPVPTSAYGGSKLVAEKIHGIWQASDAAERKLVIVRPGVVFGPGEGGNVSRLIRAVHRRYFAYMGNRSTRKAGVYVLELCNAIWWALDLQRRENRGTILFNMSMNPGPSIQEYVDATCSVAGIQRYVPSVPYWVLMLVAWCLEVIARPLRIQHPFSPVRIQKLVRSNDIRPGLLLKEDYPYVYDLRSSFADWKEKCPEEWQ